jgi:hypothetical protein
MLLTSTAATAPLPPAPLLTAAAAPARIEAMSSAASWSVSV